MLSIVITRLRIYAGICAENVQIMPVRVPIAPFEGEGLTDILWSEINKITSIYDASIGRDRASDPPIPLSLSFSLEFVLNHKIARKELVAKIEEKSFIRLLHNGVTALDFAHSNRDSKLLNNFIVVEAIDDYVHLFFHLERENQKSLRYKTLPELGWKPGILNSVEWIESETIKEGVSLTATNLEELDNQIRRYKSQSEFHITFIKDEKENQLNIPISSRFVSLKLAPSIESFKEILDPLRLAASKIESVFLLGNYLDNNFIIQYLTEELDLAPPTLHLADTDEEQVLKKIIRGGYNFIIDQVNTKKDTKDLALLQEEVIKEIRRLCLDPAKKEEYIQRYAQIGQNIGLPSETIEWLIESNIQKLENEKEAQLAAEELIEAEEEIVSLESIEEDETFEVEKEEDEIAGSEIEEAPESEEDLRSELITSEWIQALNSQFDIEKIINQDEFLHFVGRFKNGGNRGVYRIAPAEDVISNKETLFGKLTKLHHYESEYFDQVSSIKTIEMGHFYSRPFYEGMSLSSYLRFKRTNDVRLFSKIDGELLKVISCIWEEIEKLPEPQNITSTDDFIIIRKLNWNLSFDVAVKYVGFNLESSSEEEMNKQVDRMLTNLFYPGLYEEIKSKFSVKVND